MTDNNTDGLLKMIANHNNTIIKNILDKISDTYDLNRDELYSKFLNIPIVESKISKQEQCQAIKQDGKRCTRRHKPNCKYCGKHISLQKKEEGDYIVTKRESINGVDYLIDDKNIVYKDCIEKSTIIGKKVIKNNTVSIEPLEPINIV